MNDKQIKGYLFISANNKLYTLKLYSDDVFVQKELINEPTNRLFDYIEKEVIGQAKSRIY